MAMPAQHFTAHYDATMSSAEDERARLMRQGAWSPSVSAAHEALYKLSSQRFDDLIREARSGAWSSGEPLGQNSAVRHILEAANRASLSALPESGQATAQAMSELDRRTAEALVSEIMNSPGFSETDPAAWVALTRGAARPDELSHLAVSRTLSKPSDFLPESRSRERFSPDLAYPSKVFEAFEQEVASLDELLRAISRLHKSNENLPLVWRGQQDARWGLHSSLYLAMSKASGTEFPGLGRGQVSEVPALPGEAEMAAIEVELIDRLREDWRLGDMPGLELLARLQHHGGPTRLLDVTRSPLVGAWFAVEPNPELDEFDARLFAIATRPALRADDPMPASRFDDDLLTQDRRPFWLQYGDNTERQRADWGTGVRRRLWIPPVYDPRISAQNAGFLLQGVALPSESVLRHFRKSADRWDERTWRWPDVMAASSFYALPSDPEHRARYNAARLAPVFSFRIPWKAKHAIWLALVNRFGYTPGTLYPDMDGLSQYLRRDTGWLRPSHT